MFEISKAGHDVRNGTNGRRSTINETSEKTKRKITIQRGASFKRGVTIFIQHETSSWVHKSFVQYETSGVSFDALRRYGDLDRVISVQ